MRRFLYFISLFLFVFSWSGVSLAQEQKSWWPVAFPQEAYLEDYVLGQARALSAEIGLKEDMTFHERVDTIRHFVNTKTEQMIDDEFYSYWHDIPRLMYMMSEGQMPHTECATRSALMYWLLKANDIRTRVIVVYAGDDVVDSHTYLEVFNPDTHKWEIQDPDQDVFWVFADTGARAATGDLLVHAVKENFKACFGDGHCDEKKVEELAHKFAIASVIDIDGNNHPLIINTDRADDGNLLTADDPLPLVYCALFSAPCYGETVKVKDVVE